MTIHPENAALFIQLIKQSAMAAYTFVEVLPCPKLVLLIPQINQGSRRKL
ncbi:hypothetical protein PAENIP36_05580 [Paenibacillus sp. P36]